MTIGYKVAQHNGTDFYSGTVNYAAALLSGEPLIHPDPQPATGSVCGRGYHVSDTPQQAIHFADRAKRPWRYFKVEFTEADIIEQDKTKKRLKAIRKVVQELSVTDIFGADFMSRIESLRAEVETFNRFPWLKPAIPIKSEAIKLLFDEWYTAITPWLNGKQLPNKFRIVTNAVDAVVAVDDADAAAADDAVAVVVDAVAAYAADAVAAADDDAVAVVVAADAVAAVDAVARHRWNRWYVRPYCVFRRYSRWQLANMPGLNLWKPLIEMFKMGALPVGYSNGEFVVYCPVAQK